MSHLDKRVSALVDGALDHEERDRALAHVAQCRRCHDLLSSERAIKERLAAAKSPNPPSQLVRQLLSIGDLPLAHERLRQPGSPPSMVPALGATGPGGWRRRPGGRTDLRRPGGARGARRTRQAAAGALSVSALVLATAFLAGGSGASQGAAVVPPAAELSVEHAATTSGLPLRDPAFDAVSASLNGIPLVPAPTVAGR